MARFERLTCAEVTRSFEELYESRYRQMVVTATVTTGSTAIAEEIVQDAFVDVYRRFESLENPEGYLRRAVLSRCTSWVRRTVVQRRHDAAPPRNSTSWTDPDVATILSVIDVLPARQRAVVVMRYFADWSEQEMADALGCRPGTVKSLLARARSRLAKELSDDPQP